MLVTWTEIGNGSGNGNGNGNGSGIGQRQRHQSGQRSFQNRFLVYFLSTVTATVLGR